MKSLKIDRITKIVLMGKDTDGRDCAVACDVASGDDTASIVINNTPRPGLTINAQIEFMRYTYEIENELDDSSEELDCFLKQFLKG